nr:hypothetical protein [uncultured Carboxylicivirga sp.]
MILTDYYKAEKLTKAKTRFDITLSTGEHDHLERILKNKRGFNPDGLSFYCGERPEQWKRKNTDLAITKGSSNITSVKRPDISSDLAFGDINGTNDGCIIQFNTDFKEQGINTIEIFIARGLRNDTNSLWDLFTDGELKDEVEALKSIAVTKKVTD